MPEISQISDRLDKQFNLRDFRSSEERDKRVAAAFLLNPKASMLKHVAAWRVDRVKRDLPYFSPT